MPNSIMLFLIENTGISKFFTTLPGMRRLTSKRLLCLSKGFRFRSSKSRCSPSRYIFGVLLHFFCSVLLGKQLGCHATAWKRGNGCLHVPNMVSNRSTHNTIDQGWPGEGDSGIPVYPKNIRQNTQNSSKYT